MAEQQKEDMRVYERRNAARRGIAPEPTLEEIFDEQEAPPPPKIPDPERRWEERRHSIRRAVDRDLHAIIMEETGD